MARRPTATQLSRVVQASPDISSGMAISIQTMPRLIAA
jgi:hypothetical protein